MTSVSPVQPVDPSAVAPVPGGVPPPSRLEPPALRPTVIPRERLLRRLAGTGAARVVTITAPAGYGKTTLLTQWAHADPRTFVWLRLEERDDDPVRLLLDVAFALERLGPVDPAVVAAARGGADALAPVALPRLGRLIRDQGRPFVLVLDDAHALRSARAHDIVRTIIEHLPERCVLVLAGRRRPVLPLGRTRASGLLDELTATDLAMTQRESAEMLTASHPGLTDERRVGEIAARCEGWAAAIYLASLAARDDAGAPLSGADLTIADYIEEEVLARCSREDRRFLTEAAILDELSGPVCDAALERDDSARRLSRLAAREILVTPLDRTGTTYRIHGLFREALLGTLDREHPGTAAVLHRRAAEHHLANGEFEAALDHVLQADAPDSAVDLIWRIAPAWVMNGRSGEVEQAIAACGDRARRAHPELDALLAWIAVTNGDGDAASTHTAVVLGAPERTLADGSSLQANGLLLRSCIGRDGAARTRDDAAAARDLEPPTSVFVPIACLMEGCGAFMLGDRAHARACLTECDRLAAGRAPNPQALALALLALLDAEDGGWDSAARLIRRARALQRAHGLEDYASQGMVVSVSALVAARTADHATAQREAALARRLAARMVDVGPFLHAVTQIALARTALALGDAVSARTLLSDAEEPASLVADAPVLRAYLDDTWEQAQALEVRLPAGSAGALTGAELRTLQHLRTHLSVREIAERLAISPNTVKTQTQSIYRKLGVSSRSQAVETAVGLGLLEA